MDESKIEALEALLKFARGEESKGFKKPNSAVVVVEGKDGVPATEEENSEEASSEEDKCCPHCGKPIPA